MFAVIFFCSTKFVRETLCKFLYIYAKKNVYLYDIMINRKLCGIFGFSLAPLCKRPIFLLFVFSLFLMFWYFILNRNRNEKIRFCCVFAVIRPFLSQIKLWFSVIYAYIGQTTPHPPLLSLAGWVSSLPKIFYFFYFFIFYFFVKYYDFANLAFLLNFEHFWKYHIYFSFCIKFHSIYFLLFLCVM